VDERERRVAENEVLFNAVNEQILSLGEALSGDSDAPFSIICECGDEDCRERIELGRAEYEEVRREPARFVIRPDHVAPDTEHVVAESDEYVVVEKDEPVKSILEARERS
jgi:hypothetical protein